MGWFEFLSAIVSAIAWPVVAVVAGIFFKDEIKVLIGRVRKGGGIEFDPNPQQGSIPTEAALFVQKIRTPATEAIEKIILESPEISMISDPKAREDALVSVTARAILTWRFVYVDANIWSSQQALLNYLNTVADESLETLKKHFYEPASIKFPKWFVNYSFEGYMGFLQTNEMVEQVGNERVRITQQGQEYLLWRTAQRLIPKLHG